MNVLRRALLAGALACVAIASSTGARAQGTPPFPTAGQTVHWTAAMSPITLSSNATILWTGTVVVDPGVEVRLTGSTVLTVNGRLETSPGSTLFASPPAQYLVGING